MNISLNEVEDVIELSDGEVMPMLANVKYAQRNVIQVCQSTVDTDDLHEVQ
ncbi:hypothetical protein [Bartonella doshiae]|uniref:Uncharacterized protein n=2 Tax=Bartonella doshiae TaxID=33044 RepID=A0A380ZFJ5_BARDO|nr:hypothetical protein [Bartonella doshiae]EJF81168.1 hypothetical protein MCS_00881 [Bartonella doshiae NCTC 12862 = ATCC 700133]MBB6159956.1 hypothetical protein [Bartonella doshiae]SUV45320.1 Uncharacterised protein [Bartonella doshiae]